MSESTWKLVLERAPINVIPPPVCTFDVFGSLVNASQQPIAPVILEYSVYFMDRRIQPPGHAILEGRALSTGQGIPVRLIVRFERGLIDLVEANRAGADRVELRIDAAVLGIGSGAIQREPIDHLQKDLYLIPRDSWLGILSTFEYGTVEVIELPVRAIQLVPGYETALLRLKEAEKALGDKNWRLVLVRLWNVFEAVGEAAGAGTGQTGFEKLLADAMPAEHYTDIRSALLSLIAYLRLYQQRFMVDWKGGEIPVTREDALFAFETTLSLLSYLTRRLSQR
jgi:hypothetical protein